MWNTGKPEFQGDFVDTPCDSIGSNTKMVCREFPPGCSMNKNVCPVTCTCFHKDNFNIFKSSQTWNIFLFWIFSFYCSDIEACNFSPIFPPAAFYPTIKYPPFDHSSTPWRRRRKKFPTSVLMFFQWAIWKIRFVLPCRYIFFWENGLQSKLFRTWTLGNTLD